MSDLDHDLTGGSESEVPSGLLLRSAVSVARRDHRYGPRLYVHGTLYFAVRGKMYFSLGDEGIAGHVAAGQFLWVPPGYLRLCWTDSDGVFMYALILDLPRDGEPPNVRVQMPLMPRITTPSNPTHIEGLFKMAEQSCLHTSAWGRLETEGYGTLILALFVKSCTPPGVAPHLLQRVREVIQFIAHNYQRPDLSVEEMLENLPWSRRYFFRVFKEVTGKSPMKYLQEFRLNHALELLRSKEFSVGEVAERCGFQDPAYFSRVFSRSFGRPPSAVFEGGNEM